MDKNEALQVIRSNYSTDRNQLCEALETLIPELKESEDEKIRKYLIDGIKHLSEKSLFFTDEVSKGKVIAWLEKQGEQKPANKCIGCNNFKGCVTCTDGDQYAHITEQKPSDKVKPKFRVGDWITNGGLLVGQVTSFDGEYYHYICEGIEQSLHISNANNWHLWTIQDIKDGDVLYHKSPLSGIEYIVMSKGVNDLGNVDSYFRYHSEDGFGINIPSVFSAKLDDITPATKKQRDLLFRKMKEAGYEWDAEKKELKKIEQKPAWSEEDEQQMKSCLDFLDNISCGDDSELNDCRNWLKSLKERMKGATK